ncbi:MAG: ABC transporter ATP-binding protein [Candidatus Nanopelagicales bacterium]
MTADGGAEPGLVAHIRLQRSDFRLEADVRVAPGEVVAVLGPNGAGKSTLLRALAGLVPLASGFVRVDGQPWDEPDRGVFAPPDRRAVGMVFQDHLLFPHLTVADNVAFGPRMRGEGRAVARTEALEWLGRVGLAELAERRPRTLSGGQAQRVALARALATRPRLLLLDEPLASLDVAARSDVRTVLRDHLAAAGPPVLVVTHDPLDAFVLARRVLVVEDGRVSDDTTPAELVRRPRTDYAARVLGLNLLRGDAAGGSVVLGDGTRWIGDHSAQGSVLLCFPPRAVTLHRQPPEGSARNVLQVDVADLQRHGDLVRVSLAGPTPLAADVTPGAVAALELAPGSRLWATVKAAEVEVYPA